MAGKYLTDTPSKTIDKIIADLDPDTTLVVTDENVDNYVFPLLKDSKVVNESRKIKIPAGEDEKNLGSVTKIWDCLEEMGATRRSVVLNIGGGVVTDLGGFAAATYKRGIRTLNFPTTVLGAVDAATGGKTGINYRGLKNEIGAFHQPSGVIISALPFATLEGEEILSGYAEMIKTALISDRDFYIHLSARDKIIEEVSKLGEDVEKCVSIKEDVVSQDPEEKGLRKILNFGHTAGHAFESFRLSEKNPVSHGHAVAHGMLVAMILSHILLDFPVIEVNHYAQFLKKHYGRGVVACRDLEDIITIMQRDKKNRTYGEISFTLLQAIGEPRINETPAQKDIKEALELYIDMAG